MSSVLERRALLMALQANFWPVDLSVTSLTMPKALRSPNRYHDGPGQSA